MTKLIIDKDELENAIANLSTLSAQAGIIAEQIERIEVKEGDIRPIKYRPENIAFSLTYLLENYCDTLTKEFNELVGKAQQIKE